LRRPVDKHIDNEELEALVQSPTEGGHTPAGLSPDVLREAQRHVHACVDCSGKMSKYWQLVHQFSNRVRLGVSPRGRDCPEDSDVNWPEIAAGLWPEMKAAQLIMHAALCDHCGPLLRAAVPVDVDPTPVEEKLLAELKPPTRPDRNSPKAALAPSGWQFLKWMIPAVALLVIVGAMSEIWSSSSRVMSGSKFAEIAVRSHAEYAQGRLALEARPDSQQALNEWLKAKSPFLVELPASPSLPGEDQPYRLEGARLVQIGGKTAAFIAYQMQTKPVSLMVTPDSVAVASGGVEVDFQKVSFHYRTVGGYKVVTWSGHGLTYALVSQEGNNTQRSCMICHSSMRDRDLSHTQTPLIRQSSNTL